jgi:hypothetical protein
MKHHQTHFIKDIETAKEFKAVHDEELLESDTDYNFGHKMYFYLSKGIVYYAKKDFDNAYIMVSELLKMWHTYPQMIDVRFGAYYNTLYNKALIEMEFKQYVKSLESINELYDKLLELERLNPFQRYMAHNLAITVYNKSGYFDRGLKIINDFETLRKSLHYGTMSPNSEQSFNFYTSIVYFGVEDYKTANKYINEIINSSIEYNSDMTSIAQLMSLVIHYELGNTDLLPYRVKSVYRFLNKRDSLQSTIAHILDFIKKLGKINPQRQGKDLFIDLKSQLELDLEADPNQAHIFEYFDLMAWLESKIQNRPFMEIVKEKNGFAFEKVVQR